ncbi:DegV family protein [Bacillus sp. T33-2]|uniref:DegV family protein n=1 Tax=Bacillus sp. T33-2 TaxID=2054168 RepID=UPI000C788341|nr:DegV family protein [Bacillus sp. T33-2]PLR98914.1 DegV family protein [Bacillus sp. T33-2]
MKKIAWVTDSTAFLDEELKNNPDVYQLPMTIVLDGKEYLDGIDLSARELYEKLKTLKSPPKTSQPAVGAFKDLYEKLEKEYDEVISLLVSSKLSGTVQSSEQAAQLVGIPVSTIDSKTLTYMLTALIKKGMAWIDEGLSVEQVKEKLKKVSQSGETYVLIGSLEQLHRSGRMSGVQFFLGSMLNVKPIITLQNGELSTKAKARSDNKAKEKIFDLVAAGYDRAKFKEAFILYGLHEQVADEWKSELKQKFPQIHFSTYPLAAVIGVHAGEHTIGVSWFNEQG